MVPEYQLTGRAGAYYVILLFVGVGWMRFAGAATEQALEEAPCSEQRCGDVEVRYPFVLSGRSACPSFNASVFGLDCGSDGVLRINLTTLTEEPLALQVLGITEDSVIVNMTAERSVQECGTNSSAALTGLAVPDFPGPYLIASDNELVGFDCTITTLFVTESLHDLSAVQVGGCASACALSNVSRPSNPFCANRTCCTANFPATDTIRAAAYQLIQNDPSTPCNSTSTFSIAFSRTSTNFSSGSYGFKLSWALPDQRLSDTNTSNNVSSSHNTSFFTACSSDSSATVVAALPGYRCSCLPGFHGDGYADGKGCEDINECSLYPDCVHHSTCHNIDGGYLCRCSARWHVGDGKEGGSGCSLNPTVMKVVGGIAGVAGFALFLLALICTNVALHNRRKRLYFLQNGGIELQKYLSEAGSSRDTTRFFDAGELRAATQNFSDHLKLGGGGFGTVYRGTLEGGRVVAVKRANRGDTDSQQFLNELAILTQINHKHIVRLLGYCLETSTPLLVYEFLSNGDLAQNLASETPMNWAKRLQIAIQTADALAYLHAQASPPILHRDVKSANILLDDKLDAKVADFGVSRLIRDGEEHVSTAVQGTIGYLDPEYFQTLQLTDRSDVYSLGVMLVELVTGLKPVDNHNRETRFANLALLFLDMLREKRVEELIDARLDDPKMALEESWEQRVSILAVAKLARRCLSLRGAERPSMRQVVDELGRIATGLRREAVWQCDEEEDIDAGAVVASHDNNSFGVQSSSLTAHEPMFHTPANPR